MEVLVSVNFTHFPSTSTKMAHLILLNNNKPKTKLYINGKSQFFVG